MPTPSRELDATIELLSRLGGGGSTAVQGAADRVDAETVATVVRNVRRIYVGAAHATAALLIDREPPALLWRPPHPTRRPEHVLRRVLLGQVRHPLHVSWRVATARELPLLGHGPNPRGAWATLVTAPTVITLPWDEPVALRTDPVRAALGEDEYARAAARLTEYGALQATADLIVAHALGACPWKLPGRDLTELRRAALSP